VANSHDRSRLFDSVVVEVSRGYRRDHSGGRYAEIRTETESAEVATTIKAGVVGIMELEATVSGTTVFISLD
jgi:hypothetical protein